MAGPEGGSRGEERDAARGGGREVGDSKTSRELRRLRAAVAELTEMVNELARQQRGQAAG